MYILYIKVKWDSIRLRFFPLAHVRLIYFLNKTDFLKIFQTQVDNEVIFTPPMLEAAFVLLCHAYFFKTSESI